MPMISRTRALRLPRCAARSASSATPGLPPPQITWDKMRRSIVVSPAEGYPHTATIVGPIHGLGDSARGWLEGGVHMWSAVPHCRLIIPDAPVAPVTLNGGAEMPSWYDIEGLVERFDERCAGLEESRARINGFIEGEIEAGVPASRIVVAGFSQGGALSLVAGLRFPRTLAGVLVMSGYLAGASTFDIADEAKGVPVLHCHGSDDPMVKLEWARETKRRVVGMGLERYELKEYPGLQHSVSEQEMIDAIEFLRARLPPL